MGRLLVLGIGLVVVVAAGLLLLEGLQDSRDRKSVV